jgi:hypothetical protein
MTWTASSIGRIRRGKLPRNGSQPSLTFSRPKKIDDVPDWDSKLMEGHEKGTRLPRNLILGKFSTFDLRLGSLG